MTVNLDWRPTMDNYKFELIRADESQQITFSVSTKFEAYTAVQLIDAFVDFVSGCGFDKHGVMRAMEARIDEELG